MLNFSGGVIVFLLALIKGDFTVKELRLGFIGAGNMATAILDGVIKKELFSSADIIISNPHSDKLEYPKKLGVSVTCDNVDVVLSSDIIILAVKPQKFEAVLQEIAEFCYGKCVISIAAGISVDWITARLPGAIVVRVMPNTPLQLGLGATAIAQGENVPEEYFEAACEIFSAAGSVAIIPESQMDDIIPISGSSPAFFFRMIDVMVRWAESQGIDSEIALSMAASAMKGSAEMLLCAGKNADELTRQVCSPGGTTLAALSAFDDRDFEGLICDAMTRCTLRSKELGK